MKIEKFGMHQTGLSASVCRTLSATTMRLLCGLLDDVSAEFDSRGATRRGFVRSRATSRLRLFETRDAGRRDPAAVSRLRPCETRDVGRREPRYSVALNKVIDNCGGSGGGGSGGGGDTGGGSGGGGDTGGGGSGGGGSTSNKCLTQDRRGVRLPGRDATRIRPKSSDVAATSVRNARRGETRPRGSVAATAV